jgi:FkbM family methyltransferase
MIKRLVQKILFYFGYSIIKISSIPKAGSDMRPVGNMTYLLEDLKSRGLLCTSIFDIGANRGDWSRTAKKVFPDAGITLIEPQIEMRNELELFCEEFTDSHFYLAGAGPSNTKMILTIWDDLLGSSLLPKVNLSLQNVGKQREVNIISIDSLIKEKNIQYPELIKLDIQGFELEALKGAESTFGKTEVYILEVSLFAFDDVPGAPIFSDVINFMLERNYLIYDFGGFMRRPYDGALGQCDICFVKQSGLLKQSNRWN